MGCWMQAVTFGADRDPLTPRTLASGTGYVSSGCWFSLRLLLQLPFKPTSTHIQKSCCTRNDGHPAGMASNTGEHGNHSEVARMGDLSPMGNPLGCFRAAGVTVDTGHGHPRLPSIPLTWHLTWGPSEGIGSLQVVYWWEVGCSPTRKRNPTAQAHFVFADIFQSHSQPHHRYRWGS